MRYKMIAMGCIGLLTAGLICAVAITYAKTADDSIEANAAAMAEESASQQSSEDTRKVSEDVLTTESAGSSREFEQDSVYYEAGIQVYLNDLRREYFSDNPSSEMAVVMTAAIPELNNEESVQSEYADLAIANVTNYVNVRTAPNTDSAIAGKIYDGAVAHILAVAGEEGDWFQVVSGNVEGYIKSEFFLYGDEAVAVIDDYVTRYATVQADRLNVREQPDVASSRVGYIDHGEKVKILENLGEWLRVQYTDRSTGYVAAEYVTVSEEFVYAKTLEEEAKERAEKRAMEERKRVSEAQAAENTTITVTPPNTVYSTNEELRQQIVDYAMQYLGNKYVHGGQSLSGGTDCSGFTSLIYKEFGYSISRTPAGQLSGAGKSIDYSQIQPGDIICYGSRGKCTHVALYIGDGRIIHAANSRKGVIIGQADYDTILGVKNVID